MLRAEVQLRTPPLPAGLGGRIEGLWLETDIGNHAARLISIPAIGVEALPIAARAGVENVDVRLWHARCDQLAPVDAGQIEVSSAIESKLSRDFLAYFITTDANARADAGVNGVRAGSKFSMHFLQRQCTNLRSRAAPAGMNDRDSVSLNVGE